MGGGGLLRPPLDTSLLHYVCGYIIMIRTSHMKRLSRSLGMSCGRTTRPEYGPISVPSLIQSVENTPSITPGREDGHRVTCGGIGRPGQTKENERNVA